MSKTAKVVLIISGICVSMCLIAGVVVWKLAKGAMITDPAQVRAVGAQIVEYQLPAGHREQHAMDVMGMKTVLIGPESGKNGLVIMLMQFGMPGVTSDQMEAQLRAQSPRKGKMTPAGRETVTIRGKPAELAVYKDQDGTEVRQGIFAGKGGTAMISISGPSSAKDEVERFLGSLK